MLRAIATRFCDDDSDQAPFAGYTDGRLWNGFACPHLPLSELLRVLAVLVDWGDEQSFEVVDDHHVRVRGIVANEDYVMQATLQSTVDGERWLFNCGGAWTFVEAEDAPAAAPVDVIAAEELPPPCPHPEHRLGTNGSLRKHQRVCLQCGQVVLAPRSRA